VDVGVDEPPGDPVLQVAGPELPVAVVVGEDVVELQLVHGRSGAVSQDIASARKP
jgi:hypothetical protein